jgi:hypothetical protein
MNPVNIVTVLQGIASKKLMLVMWVIYFISGIAEKQPERAVECIYIMAGVTGCFLACQTLLDWRFGGKVGDKKVECPDAGDTVVTSLPPL